MFVQCVDSLSTTTPCLVSYIGTFWPTIDLILCDTNMLSFRFYMSRLLLFLYVVSTMTFCLIYVFTVCWSLCLLSGLQYVCLRALANLCNFYSRYYIGPLWQMYIYIMVFVCHIKSSLGHSLRRCHVVSRTFWRKTCVLLAWCHRKGTHLIDHNTMYNKYNHVKHRTKTYLQLKLVSLCF